MPDFEIEDSLNCKGLVFGVDEAGRGPWCGPVVAACVAFCDKSIRLSIQNEGAELSYLFAHLNDSKKLSVKKREELYPLILRHAIVGVGQASATEIDSINILQATFLAMRRALDEVISQGETAAHVLIDGNRLPKDWDEECSAVIKGDSLSLSIAAASVIAKVTRDKIMTALADEYPMYGWDKNAGYGTKDHVQALEKKGVTAHHRKSYAPIKKLLSLGFEIQEKSV